jgi:hypothetical protein
MELGIRLSFVKTLEFQGGLKPPLGTPLAWQDTVFREKD